MMSVIVENPSLNVWNDILERPTQKIENIEHTVLDIFADVKRNGDNAIVKYSKIFDNCTLNEFEATEDEILVASNNVSDDVADTIDDFDVMNDFIISTKQNNYMIGFDHLLFFSILLWFFIYVYKVSLPTMFESIMNP